LPISHGFSVTYNAQKSYYNMSREWRIIALRELMEKRAKFPHIYVEL